MDIRHIPIINSATVKTQDATPQDVLQAFASMGMHAFAQHLLTRFQTAQEVQEEFQVAKAALIGMGVQTIKRAPKPQDTNPSPPPD